MRPSAFVAFVSLAIFSSPSLVPRASSIDVLRATSALPAHIADSFQDPAAFQQADDGTYFVFDRRAHAVYAIAGGIAKKVVDIGPEEGRIIDPSAFALNPAGATFVVADAPLRRQRVQIFNADGGRIGGFTLEEREIARVTFDNVVLNGIGAIQFTGHSVLMSRPETGGLVDEVDFYGRTLHAFGNLRSTGYESDHDLHLALNSGFPLVDPTGGFYFVFNTGIPLFRKYDANGTFLFERHIEGAELDEYMRSLPTTWPKRPTADGDLLPFVPPAIHTAAVDRQGRLWVALMQPYTYVYDSHGEKIRTVQFKGAAIITPNSLFFTRDSRVLVTPGCYEFKPPL